MNQSFSDVAIRLTANKFPARWHKLLLAGAIGFGGLVPAWNSIGLAEQPARGTSLQRAKTNWQPRQIPRHTAKQTHLGWEVRSDHFVLFGASSLEQAQQAVADAESAWSEVGQMANFWTSVHRTPHYGAGAVSIQLITDPARAKAEPDVAMRIDGGIASASMKIAGMNSEQRTVAIRGAAVRSFFMVTALAEQTPGWVQAGVADFLSVPPEQRTEVLTQIAASGERVTETPRNLVLFFMLGDDAARAPEFLTAVGESVKKSVAGEELKLVQLRPTPRPIAAPGTGETIIDDLVNDRSTKKAFDSWCADPLIAQPQIVELPKTAKEIELPVQNMLVALKLARRFGSPTSSGVSSSGKTAAKAPVVTGSEASAGQITPKVQEFSADPPAVFPSASAEDSAKQPAGENSTPKSDTPAPPLDPAALYRQLCEADRGAWATLDTDGSLLWAGNESRLAEIFRIEIGGYIVKDQEGRRQWQLVIDDSTLLVGWLEDSKLNPDRPEAHFQLVPRR